MSQKHALSYDGAPYTAEPVLVHSSPKVSSGNGRALCSCGELSVPLPTGAARRAWHKTHKAHAAQAPELALEIAERAPEAPVEVAAPEAPEDDLIGEVPVTEFRAEEPTAPLSAVATGAAPTAVVPFTLAVAKHFWRSLGRTGGRVLVQRCFPEVSFTPDNTQRTALLDGPVAETAAAAAALQDMWSEAAEAFREWQRDDETYKATNKVGLEGRNASYALKEKFFNDFAEWFAQQLLEKDDEDNLL